MEIKQKVINIKTGKIWLDNNGVIRVTNMPGTIIDLQIAKQYISALKKIGNKKWPVLVDITHLKSITRDAREYFKTPEASSLTRVMGLIVRSPVSKIIGNFFMGLNKPPVPVKLFTSNDDAIEWMKDIID